MRDNQKHYILVLTYIIIWMLVNGFLLIRFPFFHSDEIWLAGLSRTMMYEGSFLVTEPFFDLFPRTVHGLRIIFHSFQILFLSIFGYTEFGVRILSLVSGGAVLLLFQSLLRRADVSLISAFIGTVLLSVDIQFIYASHFGRQEILLLLFMIGGLNVFYLRSPAGIARGILTGLITGLAAGVHPNAFLAAWPVSILYLLLCVFRKRRVSEGAAFLMTTALGACLFIIISLGLNPDFLREYGEFGVSAGVRTGFLERITDLLPFFRKLFFRVSGTYYTPDIRIQLILIPILFLYGTGFAVYRLYRKKYPGPGHLTGIAGILGVTAGLIIIGKYSQPSIVFYFPFIYILFSSLPVFRSKVALLITVILVSGMSIYQMGNEISREVNGFQDYNMKLEEHIPPGSRVLTNLNSGLAFSPSDFLDWRNTAMLKDTGLSVEEYIRSRDIEFIVYPEELDYIYNSRPVWNIMYGNPYPWYEELQEFMDTDCRRIAEFISPGYGMRIVNLRHTKGWKVDIYEVLSPSIRE